MDISKLFGLPAHPLLVHIPIVLVPLVSIGGVCLAFVPSWRRRFGWVLVGLAGIALVSVQLAIGSGEALDDHVNKSAALHQHAEMASSMRPLALLLFVVLLGLVLLDARREVGAANGATQLRWAMPLLSALVVLMSVVSTVRLAQIGHNGARASWGHVNLGAGHAGGDGD